MMHLIGYNNNESVIDVPFQYQLARRVPDHYALINLPVPAHDNVEVWMDKPLRTDAYARSYGLLNSSTGGKGVLINTWV